MISKVERLDEASQTVRLALGSSEDGSRNGKVLSPAVAITPATATPLAINANPSCRARRIAFVQHPHGNGRVQDVTVSFDHDSDRCRHAGLE